MNDLEFMALIAGIITSAFVLIIAACLCSYLDHRTQARIWQDKRDLSRLKCNGLLGECSPTCLWPDCERPQGVD